MADNVTRGRLAEFLVSRALGLTDSVKDAWGPWDLRTPSGLELQVKCCAYLQSWGQRKLSDIRFDIRSKLAWDSATNRYGAEVKRHAHAYVFCLLHHQDKATVDPLDLAQWTFYVLSTERLNMTCASARSISLGKLLTLEPTKADFGSLAQVVRELEKAGEG